MPDVLSGDPMVSRDHHLTPGTQRSARQCRNEAARQTCRADG
jgi:hypothetical protein